MIHLPAGEVWQEQVSASARAYATATQPISPPTLAAGTTDVTSKIGISIIASNSDGSLLATKDESAPTTLWIWDLKSISPKTVLIQHAPIKSVSWHPTLPNMLLIHCVQDEQFLYLWNSTESQPLVAPLSFAKSQGRVDATWIETASGKRPAILLGDSLGCILVWPEGQDAILRFESPNGTDESNDSLYEILTGKKATQAPNERTMVLDDIDDDDDTGTVDDTFMGKRGIGI